MYVNDVLYEREVPLRMLLVDFVRDVCGLTGTHIGCTYEGRCGACTIHIEGEAYKSCMKLAVQVDGMRLTTVEGLAGDGQQHPLQKAFAAHHALQCGYCTSGILMNAADFLCRTPDPSESEIRRALIGNLCRCTGYSHIVTAIREAAAEMRRAGS